MVTFVGRTAPMVRNESGAVGPHPACCANVQPVLLPASSVGVLPTIGTTAVESRIAVFVTDAEPVALSSQGEPITSDTSQSRVPAVHPVLDAVRLVVTFVWSTLSNSSWPGPVRVSRANVIGLLSVSRPTASVIGWNTASPALATNEPALVNESSIVSGCEFDACTTPRVVMLKSVEAVSARSFVLRSSVVFRASDARPMVIVPTSIPAPADGAGVETVRTDAPFEFSSRRFEKDQLAPMLVLPSIGDAVVPRSTTAPVPDTSTSPPPVRLLPAMTLLVLDPASCELVLTTMSRFTVIVPVDARLRIAVVAPSARPMVRSFDGPALMLRDDAVMSNVPLPLAGCSSSTLNASALSIRVFPVPV